MATKTSSQTGTGFSWKPLIEIPKSIPSISYLQGDDAGEFLDEFNAKAVEQYGNAARNVNKLSYDSNSKLLRGSSPFIVVHADNLLKSQGIRVATMADLERALTTNTLDLRGTYEDTALVLRSESDPNTYLAASLSGQLNAGGRELRKTPIVIQLRGLELVKDSDSNYGLAFKLTDESKFFEAPQLAEKNNGRTFKALDENGLPMFDEKGGRYNYTIKSGLSRLYLDGDLNLGSNNGYLADSNEYGRVALVRDGEAVGADFVRNAYDKAQSELSGKIATAQGIIEKARIDALNALK